MFKGFRYSQGEFANYEPSGHYMYRQFNIQQFYVLPTQTIYVFCVDLRTNSDYFPTQRKSECPLHPQLSDVRQGTAFSESSVFTL